MHSDMNSSGMRASNSEERIALLSEWLVRMLDCQQTESFERTLEKLRHHPDQQSLTTAVALASRMVGKRELSLGPQDLEAAGRTRPGFDPTTLTLDQTARIIFILACYQGDDAGFARMIADLQRIADVGESIAILRGLPMFPAAAELLAVAAEGVRSAIKPVFEAIAHRNPFPAEFFAKNAWNQMLLKAVFIGSPLAPIRGLRERANPELAEMLVDYANERWSAGRPVSPEVWFCVGPFAKGRTLDALERVLATGEAEERAAASAALRGKPL